MQNNTKIVCTIGPASEKKPVMKKMMNAGMTCARLNFSHGEYKHHEMLIKNLRSTAKSLGREITILQDLQGPRIRLGKLPAEGVAVKRGEEVCFTTGAVKKVDQKIKVTYAQLHNDVSVGDRILVEDGLYTFVVSKIKGKDIFTQAMKTGVLYSNKGMNFPDTSLALSPITAKDKKDLEFGITHNVDYVALSFVKDAKNIKSLRRLIKKYEDAHPMPLKTSVKVIAKIERFDAIMNLDEIIDAVDGIMVARGDLGVELEPQEVPILQKKIIEKCRMVGKPVIVATQMLESMKENSRPTRAEASDVANAVIDHTDAVMLSAESAMGKNPVETVQLMSNIIGETEMSQYDDVTIMDALQLQTDTIYDGLGFSTLMLSQREVINSVVLISDSPALVQSMSKYRPELQIIVLTTNKRLARQLDLQWGVYAIYKPATRFPKKSYEKMLVALRKDKYLHKGDQVMVINTVDGDLHNVLISQEKVI